MNKFLRDAKSFAKNYGATQYRKCGYIKVFPGRAAVAVVKMIGTKPGYMGFIYVVIKKGKELKGTVIDTFHESRKAEIKSCKVEGKILSSNELQKGG